MMTMVCLVFIWLLCLLVLQNNIFLHSPGCAETPSETKLALNSEMQVLGLELSVTTTWLPLNIFIRHDQQLRLREYCRRGGERL